MKKYITIAALLAAGSVLTNAETETTTESVTITEDGTLTAPGNLYAGAFNFTFTIEESVLDGYDIILAYYQVNGSSYNVNAFMLNSNNEGVLTLSLNRGGALSSTELTNDVTMGTQDSSTFKTTEGTAYELIVGNTYKVDYLGGTNGSAAADLYLGNEVVASFTGGSHNMNGAQSGGLTLNVKVNDAYVIPEPSTFGLLAGLGALALVGTRRRNRR